MTEDVRMERDTFGEIAVPSARLWGAQTQRSLLNFRISTEKQPPELIEERLRLGLVHHVLLYPRVGPGQRTQLVDPVRVREEPAVEEEVDVDGDAVLVPERHDARLQRRDRWRVLAEELVEAVAQRVDVEHRGVNDEVGLALEPSEELSLAGDAVDDALGVRERVAAPGLLESADEHVVGGVEEHDAREHALGMQLGERTLEVVHERARAHVDHKDEPSWFFARVGILPGRV